MEIHLPSVWVYSTYTSGSNSRTIFSNRHSTSNGFTLYAPLMTVGVKIKHLLSLGNTQMLKCTHRIQ